LTYTTSNNQIGFIVFSEVYYDKGWQAYMDGKKIDHIRVNYILRGIHLPKGKHKIEFKFHPKTYYVGNTIGLYASIGLLIMVAGIIGVQFKRKLSKA
jgi:uncharacterized membrane protein YfhO